MPIQAILCAFNISARLLLKCHARELPKVVIVMPMPFAERLLLPESMALTAVSGRVFERRGRPAPNIHQKVIIRIEQPVATSD